MIACLYSGTENLPGADDCVEYLLSRTDLSLPKPTTAVERGLWKDRISELQPRKSFAVTPDTPISRVLEEMIAKSFGYVMIVIDDTLLEIFSEVDALPELPHSRQ